MANPQNEIRVQRDLSMQVNTSAAHPITIAPTDTIRPSLTGIIATSVLDIYFTLYTEAYKQT